MEKERKRKIIIVIIILILLVGGIGVINTILHGQMIKKVNEMEAEIDYKKELDELLKVAFEDLNCIDRN